MLKYKTFNAQSVYGLYFLMLKYKAFNAQSVHGYGLYFFRIGCVECLWAPVRRIDAKEVYYSHNDNIWFRELNHLCPRKEYCIDSNKTTSFVKSYN